MKSLFTLSVGLWLALLTGCATNAPTVTSHPDTSVTYANYRTFQMIRPTGVGTVGNSAVTPTLMRQVRQEVEAAFAARGLEKSPDAYADALVLVHGGVVEKLEIQDWGLGYTRFGRGRQELSQHKEGSLFIDVFDARTRELIWRGSLVAEADQSPDPAKVKAAVDAIISRYPN
jgi:hypothetical protein